MSAYRITSFLALLFGTAAALVSASCTATLDRACPDLGAVCPEVACVQHRVDDDGCATCACDDDMAPAICWDRSDCAEGARCDIVNFCERAPGCDEDGPCPNACYGRCVAAPAACDNDESCPPGERCALFETARPEGASGAQPTQPAVCISSACSSTVTLPPCPPGSEPVFDPVVDPCRATCVAADPCRRLLPERCVTNPACTLVEEPCACTGPECGACTSTARCVAADDCGRRAPDDCLAHPNCVLKTVGHPDGEAPECAPGDPACDPPPPPPPDARVCVPRSIDGSCVVDAECRVGEVCKLSTTCAAGCEPDGNDGESCFQECWTERGLCVPSDDSCSYLDAASCAQDPRCAVRDPGAGTCACGDAGIPCGCPDATPACEPTESKCTTDLDCPTGQSCFITEECAQCDPSTGQDVGCIAPCFLEGRCVVGPAPPPPCAEDAECGAGYHCVDVSICETCDGTTDANADNDQTVALCDTSCRSAAVCKPVRQCEGDAQCPAGTTCDLASGLCLTEPPENTLCQGDGDCKATLRCATELELCLQHPDEPGCWSKCVDRRTGYCMEDAECDADESCVFSAEVCLDDPSNDEPVCSGWCGRVCLEAVTPGRDLVTGACVEFPNSCLPPGWVVDYGC